MYISVYDDHTAVTTHKTAVETLVAPTENPLWVDIAFMPIADFTDATVDDDEVTKVRAIYGSKLKGTWVLSADEEGCIDGVFVRLPGI